MQMGYQSPIQKKRCKGEVSANEIFSDNDIICDRTFLMLVAFLVSVFISQHLLLEKFILFLNDIYYVSSKVSFLSWQDLCFKEVLCLPPIIFFCFRRRAPFRITSTIN